MTIHRSHPWTFAVAVVAIAAVAGCSRDSQPPSTSARTLAWRPPKNLAEWMLFKTDGDKLVHQPADGVVPYDLNSALFSDYTTKYRFVKLPAAAKAKYDAKNVFDFPVETVIAKTFSYPRDLRDMSKGEKLLETRILYHHPTGWKAITYKWNDVQTAATLLISGDVVPSDWIDADGSRKHNDYVIPDQTKCASCHEIEHVVTPIGPAARHLNKDYAYPGGLENQLVHWTKAGILDGAPSDPNEAPKLAVWDDPSTGTLDQRARAWMEINCAHCHNPKGPARTSGLDLSYDQTEPEKLGIWKTPVAVGRGGGGRRFSIVPGKPDESILLYRIDSLDAGIMMPEVARRMVHAEGVALVREWIQKMHDPLATTPKNAAASGGQ